MRIVLATVLVRALTIEILIVILIVILIDLNYPKHYTNINATSNNRNVIDIVFRTTVEKHKSCITLRTLNYGNDGIFLIMGNTGFIPSTLNPKP